MDMKDSEVPCNKIYSCKTSYYISMNFSSRFVYVATIEEMKDKFDIVIKSSQSFKFNRLSLKCNYRYIK